jgi:glycosyltransferase involved in cell wall biosynthesis
LRLGLKGFRSVPQPSSRIVVHDYSGHPGQAQLSRALARRGYAVTHQHCPSYATGKGSLERQADDPSTLEFEACEMDGTFAKYSAFTRIRQELAYGRAASRSIADRKPAVAVISNVPLLAHWVLARDLSRRGIPMVFWHQDIYSEGIGAAARRRLPVLGRFIAWLANRFERTIASRSFAIVPISPTFLRRLETWGVADRATVVPNWAPIEELPVRPSDNAWSRRMGLDGHRVLLYSGTLGLKHDPSLLALLAAELRHSEPDVRVVVVSEGMGRDWLEAWKREHEADNLVLLDFQPYSDLPDVLASADVLVAILEPDASQFSVPSKVLTYLCTSRAILGVLPPENSVAEILSSYQAGWVVHPSQRDQVVAAAKALLDDTKLRRAQGRAGRCYAEANFSPDAAAERFVSVFADLVSTPVVRRVAAAGRAPSEPPVAAMRREASESTVLSSGGSAGH